MKKVGYTGNKEFELKILENHLGIHVLIEIFNCTEIISDSKKLEIGFCDVARNAGAHVVNANFHTFSPYGVSGVVVIKESHFTIHTWPEHGYAAIDVFSCTTKMSMKKAIDGLICLLGSDNYKIEMISRGDKKSFKH